MFSMSTRGLTIFFDFPRRDMPLEQLYPDADGYFISLDEKGKIYLTTNPNDTIGKFFIRIDPSVTTESLYTKLLSDEVLDLFAQIKDNLVVEWDPFAKNYVATSSVPPEKVEELILLLNRKG